MAAPKTSAGKKVAGLIKLMIPAGGATPAPPVGPALGQRGLNIQEFCKAFNAATASEEKGLSLPVSITCFEDRTFSFHVKRPPMTELIKRALSLQKGSAEPHLNKVGKLSREQVLRIAREKISDLNTDDPEIAARIVIGSARSMGVDCEAEAGE